MTAPFRLPDLGSGLQEAVVVRWLVAAGDAVAADTPLCEVETEKAIIEVPAPHAGVVARLAVAEGETVRVGGVLVEIESVPSPGERSTAHGGSEPLSPMHAEPHRATMSARRRVIARAMAMSWAEIPHVFCRAIADVTGLQAARRAIAAAADAPCPIDALLIGAVVPALRACPSLNARVVGDELIQHAACDIGFAVDTGQGLVVPVVARAGALSLPELARRVTELIERAATGRLRPDELAGATFTVNNIGALGDFTGTSIIPYGTTGILSFGRVADTVGVLDGRIVIAPALELTLSFDHRALDGRAAAAFLDRVRAELADAIARYTGTTPRSS